MRKLTLAFALLVGMVGAAGAQCNGVFPPTSICGSISGGVPGPLSSGSLPFSPSISYPVVSPCNGIADDTANVVATMTTAAATGGIVQLPGKGSNCRINISAASNSGVILQGAGMAGASPGITTTKFGTTITWFGAKGGTVWQCVDLAVQCGIRDVRIDCEQLSPDSASATAVLIQSNTEPLIQNVAVENCGYGFQWLGTTAGVARASGASGSYINLRAQNVFDCFNLNGGIPGINAQVTDFDLFGVKCQNYFGRGIAFISGLDDIKFHGVYIQAGSSGTIAIYYNPNSVGNPAQPTTTVIDGLTFGDVAGGSGIICNDTAGATNIVRAALWGGNGGSSITVNAGCVLDFRDMNTNAQPICQIPYDIWVGGTKTGNATVGYLALDVGATTFIWPRKIGGGGIFSPITKIEWVTLWDAATTTGGIELFDVNNAVPVTGTASVPGSAGARETTIDVTNYIITNWTSTSFDYQARLYIKGDGATSPIIYRSFLRVSQNCY